MADGGWLYLAIVLDLFNREVIDWSLKPRMAADIVTDALTMAWLRRRKSGHAIFQHTGHSTVLQNVLKPA